MAGNEDRCIEGSLSSCESKLEPVENGAVIQYYRDGAGVMKDFNQSRTPKQGQMELPPAEDLTMARTSQQTAWKHDQVVALQCRTLVGHDVKGQGASAGSRSRSVSYGASSVDDVLRQPFCSSGEGPLLPSASTTLSFLSSDTSVSLAHRVTDLTSLHAIATLAVQLQETGDGKSQTGVADFAEKQKPGCTPQEELLPVLQNRTQQQQQQQQQEQAQLQREYMEEAPMLHHPPVSPPKSPHGGLSKQLSSEDGAKNCSVAPLSKRPDTRERHRMGRFATRERRWNNDIMRAILMGNQASLGEQSAVLPRLFPAELMSRVPPAEADYVARQIEQVQTSCEAGARTSGFLPSGQAPQKQLAKMSAKEDTTAPALSRDSSADRGGQPQTKALNDVSLPTASQQLSQGPSALTLPEPLTAGHAAILGPSGEQRKVGAITEAVCDIELADQQATGVAFGRAVLGLKADDVVVELVKSPLRPTFVGDNVEHLIPSPPAEIGSESQLRTPSPQLDACERGLLESVKMLVDTFAATESFSNVFEPPSAEDLLMSDTTLTLPSRVEGALQSPIDCTLSLDPCCSVMSHITTGRPKRVRSRQLTSRIPEGLCFESIYNSILQYGAPPPGLSASIPVLGSLDKSGPPVEQETLSAPLPEQSCFRSQARICNASVTTEPAAASGFTTAAPEFDEGHVVSSGRVTEGNRLIPRSQRVARDAASPRRNHPRRQYGSLASGASAGGQHVLQTGEGSEVARRSSFLSFDQSGSETSLLQEAGAQERAAASPTSSADQS